MPAPTKGVPWPIWACDFCGTSDEGPVPETCPGCCGTDITVTDMIRDETEGPDQNEED